MRLIGITGSIACGKTTVSNELLRLGYPVIDGDRLSHELTGPGGAAVRDVISVFGKKYLNPDGSMNRREMSKLVFSDSRARQQLDLLMEPHLRSRTVEQIKLARESGAELCFLDMPLLFEKGYDSLCDTVWCVWLPENIQLERLLKRDGCTEQEAYSRIRAVMSSDEKADLSSAVIDNSGSEEDTLEQLDFLLQKEIARAGQLPRRRRSAGSSPSSGSAPSGANPPAAFPPSIERSSSSRRKPSGRKVSWKLPRWLLVSLVSLSVIIGLSLTGHILMRAYLVRQHDKHVAEQKAVDVQYPLQYRDIIVRIAAEYNLSPSLVASVIRNESSFRPEVESSVGARGLMQLMPDTAEWIAHKLKLDHYAFVQLYDPETNIRFGCWYLNYLSSLFHSDPFCVICAYHAGQGQVSSWLSNPVYSSDGVSLMPDKLPDGPTKTYAGRVTRDYGIYKAKYFVPDSSASSGPDADSN